MSIPRIEAPHPGQFIVFAVQFRDLFQASIPDQVHPVSRYDPPDICNRNIKAVQGLADLPHCVGRDSRRNGPRGNHAQGIKGKF